MIKLCAKDFNKFFKKLLIFINFLIVYKKFIKIL